jgi:hypothetical protein
LERYKLRGLLKQHSLWNDGELICVAVTMLQPELNERSSRYRDAQYADLSAKLWKSLRVMEPLDDR